MRAEVQTITWRLVRASVVLLLFAAAVTTARAQSTDELAARGEAIANQDPLAVELRNRQSDGPARRGFDIGMAAAEGHTLPGPGKQRIHDSLSSAEQQGFTTAVLFSLERNRNADFAARGAAVAKADPIVGVARNADPDVFYRLGFDIASGIFGNPALGGQGNTATGPGSLKIRASLSAAGQRGFNAAVAFHTSEGVTSAGQPDTRAVQRRGTGALATKGTHASIVTADTSEGVTSAAQSDTRAVPKPGTGAPATKGTHATILTPDLWKAPFIGNVQVTPGWKLVISFASTQKTKPLVEIGPVAPIRGQNGMLTFPVGSGAVSQPVFSSTGLYYSEFDVLRAGFEVNRSYYYIINVFNDNPKSLRERDQETGRFTMASAGNPSYVCAGDVGHVKLAHVLGVDGSVSSCSPYLCQAGRCDTTCNSVEDCAPPFVCDRDSKCILPPRD